MTTNIHLIGIGDDGLAGLPKKYADLIGAAQLLAGGTRHLSFFPDHGAEKFPVKSNLKELAERLARGLEKNERMVVLASGDPLFHGIGSFLLKKIPPDRLEILPAPSAMQLAFAAAKLPWDEAELVSVHAKPLERLLEPARSANVIGVFTEDGASPGKIAKFLGERGLDLFDAIVCEKLGNENQQVRRFPLSELNGHIFDPLNTLILVRRNGPGSPERMDLGLPEEAFAHRKPKLGLITKSEIRILSVAKLRLFDAAVVWDIGAGSGSVSIECARLAPGGKVFAVEKNEEDIANVRENIERFHVPNVVPIHGRAPEALADIPADPDAVFVGGSAGRMLDILDAVLKRLRPAGRIVLNLATVENLAETIQSLKTLGLQYELISVQISRGSPILEMTRFEALNPVTVVTAWKK
ncbi:precorrin-6y C5,15-methyltransferase (decarboxylating) subunit CbiE [bacterium]|nr:precorrin-6y C5,15-methyltransferase (decarboxylating) subunit CbiE [bacterium]